MHQEEIEKILHDLEPKIPDISTRRVLSERLGGMLSHRTLANIDSLNRGISVKLRLNRKVGYPKQAVLEWLRKNLTIECND